LSTRRRLLAAVSGLCLLAGHSDAWFSRGAGAAFGPGSAGFLATCASTFAPTNQALRSQAFATAPWSATGTTTAPTVTNNTVAAPDATITGSSLILPAVSGANAGSYLTQAIAGTAPTFHYTFSVYVRGAVGGERLWLASSRDSTGNPGTWSSVPIAATTSWQRVSLTYLVSDTTAHVEIGVDLRDSAQTAAAAGTVYLWGAQYTSEYEVWPYIPTTSSAVTQRISENCPVGTAFRDFAPLTFYSGNPITPQNTAAYNAGGTSAPYIVPWGKIGSTYYALANCTVAGANRPNWPNQCLYSGPDPEHWTDHAAGNPVLTGTPGNWDDHYLLHGALSPACSVANWCYYYSANDSGGTSSIGLATSPDLVTWSKHGTSPLITYQQPAVPTIIQIGSTLYMYTAVNGGPGGTYIVFFTSPASDGITWTFGGTVLEPPIAGDWDFNAVFVQDPWVFRNSHGFLEMVFTSTAFTACCGGVRQQMGYAISLDGIHWFKYQAAAIVTQQSAAYPGDFDVGDGVFFQDGTTFHLLYNFDNSSTLSAGEAATMPDH
jgi:hypothetical protein